MEQVQQSSSQGDLRFIPPKMIFKKPGFNPRRKPIRVDDPDFIDFRSSVRSQGVVQPITIRPRPEGGYWLVAGERRWLAATLENLPEMPAYIRDLSDAQALEVATIENTNREDMSAVEEAESARKILDAVDGNRDEAMRRLGWSRNKLERRLLLIHAAQEVRDAFLEGKVDLGHVELLSTLPAETQVGTLAKVIEKAISVKDLKDRMGSFAQNLAAAIFDKAGCQGCPQNSDQQASLFDEHIGGGRCSNRECFAQKTRTALEAKKATLQGEVNAVFLDVEKEPSSYVIVAVSGEDGIGTEQFAQCKGCGNFGVLLSSAPGQEGRVTQDVCFNRPCHGEKAKEYRAQIEAEKKEEQAAVQKGGKGSDAGKGKGKPTATSAKKGGKTAKATLSVAAVPKKVTEHVHQFYRDLAGEVVGADKRMMMAHVLYALYDDSGKGFDLKPYLGKEGSRYQRPGLVAAFYALGEAEAFNLLRNLTVHIASKKKVQSYGMSDEMVETAVRITKVTNTALPGRFKLTAEFLQAHTKAGIEALMAEAKNAEGQSFIEWYNARANKPTAFKSLMGDKVETIIKTILESGFDFSQFVPACVITVLKDDKSKD